MVGRVLPWPVLGFLLAFATLDAASAQNAPADLTHSRASSPAASSDSTPAVPGAKARAPAGDWQLVVEAPPPLRALLMENLDVARYRHEAMQSQEGSAQPVRITRSELRRLLAEVPAQARGLLEAEGYFGARVRIKVDEGGAVPAEMLVTVFVEPGPRTTVDRVRFVYEGDLDKRITDGEKDAKLLAEGLADGWSLPRGEPFRQTDWSNAKNTALARLRSGMYPMASWSGTSATVDASSHSASLFLVADSGPGFSFGEVRIEGLVRQPPSAILNLASFREGQSYRERLVLDWQERIQRVNLFESVYVSPAFDLSHPEATPLIVQVREAPMQEASFGIGVSSDNGPRLSFEHLHRNPFALDWQVRTKAQLGLRVSDALIDLLSHPWPGRKRGLASMQASSIEDNDNAITRTQRLKVGRLREGERLERTDYFELVHASVRSAADLLVSNATAVSFTSQWLFRDVDSQVLPTRGTTTMLSLTGGRTLSALENDGHFGRVHARFTAYVPMPSRWQLQLRAEGGHVLVGEGVSVPDSLLFRAGGDDSIRGYAHRSIGVERGGVTTGARVLGTGSIELSHPFWPGSNNLLGAVFMDVGDATERLDQWALKRGHGLGIRWRSPVGPFRIDIARGVSTNEWRLHFSVGVSL